MRRATLSLLLPLLICALSYSAAGSQPKARSLELPWKVAGLSERQAAAHLLDRFAFGPRPGEVDRVVAMGLATWLESQLAGGLAEPRLEGKLAGFRSLEMTLEDLVATYPNPGVVLREMQRQGQLDEGTAGTLAQGDRRRIRREMVSHSRQMGYRPQREMLGEMMSQKVLRATYAENQLLEVLVDFWFNHLYVSLADNEVRAYMLAYERDAIRPHVLADFRTLLGASARHPAMLLYLDNARSTAAEGEPTTMRSRMGRFGRQGQGMDGRRRGRPGRGPQALGRRGGGDRQQAPQRRSSNGLNENYARELLELHTLGVDGGYDQEDVVEVARAFTGWTVVPPRGLDPERLARLQRAGRLGFQIEDGFLFRADAHDSGRKEVLGQKLPAGRGIEDGEQVLDLVAAHGSTARHLARKLAVRFVSDDPPSSLVDALASTYASTGGDLKAMVRALAQSPEFWSPEARQAKIKSPFELAISALRIVDAEVTRPRELLEWISRMGQPLYAYQAPTGYPDTADAWVNTGALLNRMNFGLELAAGRIEGVRLDLTGLNGDREPESRRDALETYLGLLLPERDHRETLARLEPAVHSADLAQRVAEATPEAPEGPSPYAGLEEMERSTGPGAGGDQAGGLFPRWQRRPSAPRGEPTALEQVVGVILGSPEFQRR